MMKDTVTGNGEYAEEPPKTDADSQHIPQGTGPSKNRDTLKQVKAEREYPQEQFSRF